MCEKHYECTRDGSSRLIKNIPESARSRSWPKATESSTNAEESIEKKKINARYNNDNNDRDGRERKIRL